VVVWLYAGLVEQFGSATQQLLNEHELLVSPIVRLEVQYLFETGRMAVDAETILADLARRLGLAICPKPFDAVMVRATAVTWTRDPFDRILVAHAALHDHILVTKDQAIRTHYVHARW
jgi:PIN domain nuclease of toxin-antitoxin system